MPKPRIDNPLFIKTEKEITSDTSPASQEASQPEESLEFLKSKSLKLKEFKTLKLPKFKTLEPLLIRLRKDQISLLDRLCKQIMKGRAPGNKRERITKNTIIRACLDIILKMDIDTKEIPDENELLNRIAKKMVEKRDVPKEESAKQ